MLEKSLKSPLNGKEIKLINQPWTFIEGLMLKLKLHTLPTWNEEPTHWKIPWCQERLRGQKEKGSTEVKMVGWHHQVNWHEFEQTLGACEGQGSLACCSPWCRKELTWFIDWTYIYKTAKLLGLPQCVSENPCRWAFLKVTLH